MSTFNGLDDRDALVQLRAVLQFAADSYHDMASRMVGESRIAMGAMGEHYDRGVMLVDDRLEDLDAEASTPAVDLPTEPTLGWAAGPRVHATGDFAGLGFWDLGADREYLNRTSYTHPDGKGDIHLDASKLTAFTPAVAVPKAALDDLRRDHSADLFEIDLDTAVVKFLAAVDAANGDPR